MDSLNCFNSQTDNQSSAYSNNTKPHLHLHNQTYNEFSFIIFNRFTCMDSILIYDIESELASENGEEHSPYVYPMKKQQKQTQISDVPPTKIIEVRSTPPQHKYRDQTKQHQNIIFYEEDLTKSINSIDIDQTNRALLNNQQQDSDADDQEEYDQVQELVEINQKVERFEKQRKIIPQQMKLKNETVVVKANAQLFIKQIVPHNYKITCMITVERNFLGIPTFFRMFLKEPYQFLLSAKKEALKYYSNFLISKHPHEIHKRSDLYQGRLQSNFIGTSYSLYTAKDLFQSLKLVINYDKNIIGFNGPRTFKVSKLNPELKSNLKNNLSTVMQRSQRSKLIELATSTPILKRGKYRIDFGGQIKRPSPKNFILQHNFKPNINRKSLLFGKVEQNQYIAQIQYPLTVIEAFGICLSSLDSKLMVN